jgi:hypothetical protein
MRVKMFSVNELLEQSFPELICLGFNSLIDSFGIRLVWFKIILFNGVKRGKGVFLIGGFDSPPGYCKTNNSLRSTNPLL